jgi:hypothetical protein
MLTSYFGYTCRLPDPVVEANRSAAKLHEVQVSLSAPAAVRHLVTMPSLGLGWMRTVSTLCY